MLSPPLRNKYMGNLLPQDKEDSPKEIGFSKKA
jgi:hypothetical protein